MKIIDIALTPGEPPRARAYLHDTSPEMPARAVRPCVVICPGGGYARLSDREKDPPALALFAAGYQVVTLTYSVAPEAGQLRPLIEVSRLLMALRADPETYAVAPDKIAVLGFSAGGHLAASLGTLWNHQRLTDALDTRGGQNRPDALILCYPVITAGGHRHAGSLENVSGGDPALLDLFSLEHRVSPATPPAFLWHTADDEAVPVENTLLFAAALRKHGVPFEAHIFAHGRHGLSMCNEEVATPNKACAPWFPLAVSWLNAEFGFEW